MRKTQTPQPKYRDVTTHAITCLSIGFLFLTVGIEHQNCILLGISGFFLLVAFLLLIFLLTSRCWPKAIERVDDFTGAALFPVILVGAFAGLVRIIEIDLSSNLPLILGLLFVVFIALLVAAIERSLRRTAADWAMRLKVLAITAGVLAIIQGTMSIKASIYVLAFGLMSLAGGLFLDYWAQ